MTKISAPYNFVPLNKEVYFPEWAPFINHDVPFKDGLSGKIKLEITTESPIFIGSGKELNGVKQFCQDTNGRYFIPGSSIRNMLRSVVEIMSFGKLNVVDDNYDFSSIKHIKNFKERIRLLQDNFEEKMDFSECIFGAIEEKKNKGRLAVGHSFITKDAGLHKKEYKLILNSPKPSFYPFYLEQKPDNIGNLLSDDYIDYENSEFVIRGRKRYPIHYNFEPEKIVPKEMETKSKKKKKSEVETSFLPLNEGNIFEANIIYHNLLPIELGAVLSAITFHNSPNCVHNIGFAKPYGFGKIKICIENIDSKTQLEYMGLFEKEMKSFHSDWLHSIQIEELFSMANLYEAQDKSKMQYMNLNEYADAKQKKKETLDEAKKRLGDRFINKDEFKISNKMALPKYSDFMLNGEVVIPKSIPVNTEVDLSPFKKHFELMQGKKLLKNKLTEISSKLKEENKIKNTKLKSVEITNVKKGIIIEAVITNLKPNVAKIVINDEEIKVQLVFQKGTDVSKLNIGDEIKVEINQIAKTGKINQVKYSN